MFSWYFICHSLLQYIYISFKLMKPVDSLVMFVTWSCTVINCVALGCWFDITCYVLISYYVHIYTAISFILLALFLVFYSLSFDIWSQYSCLIYIYTWYVFSYFHIIPYHIVLCLQWNMWEHHVNMCNCLTFWICAMIRWIVFCWPHLYNIYIYSDVAIHFVCIISVYHTLLYSTYIVI